MVGLGTREQKLSQLYFQGVNNIRGALCGVTDVPGICQALLLSAYSMTDSNNRSAAVQSKMLDVGFFKTLDGE